MTSKTLSLGYGDITLFFTISKYFCVTIVKLSLRTKNLPLEKFCPYEVNFLCGNRTEVNRIVSQVLIS